MTLTQTLQIKERFLKFEDMRALNYVERRWKEEGCPAERWQMINFIERMLQELQQNGIGYPKVLLLRKKEMQRRTFVPCEESRGRLESQFSTNDGCAECHGRGFLVLPDGNGTLCRACLGRGGKSITREIAARR